MKQDKNNKLDFEKQKKNILIGVTKDDELVFICCEIGSCNNNHYTITHDSYEGMIDEETGEANAHERLSESDYWEDLGMLGEIKNNILLNFIDFEKAADYVIINDGWQNTNGEFQELGTYQDKSYYINFSSCGADAIGELKKDYKLLLITEEERQILIDSDKLHLKDFKKYSKKEKELFKKVLAIMNKKDNETLADAACLIPLFLGETLDFCEDCKKYISQIDLGDGSFGCPICKSDGNITTFYKGDN